MYYEEKVIDGKLYCRGKPNGQWHEISSNYLKGAAFNALMAMSREDRLSLFGYFCKGCGDQNPSCNCMRDE